MARWTLFFVCPSKYQTAYKIDHQCIISRDMNDHEKEGADKHSPALSRSDSDPTVYESPIKDLLINGRNDGGRNEAYGEIKDCNFLF